MYMLMVLATAGHGQLKKTGSATVRVSVTDENDNSPRLIQARAFLAVRENLPVGSGFGRVLATDRDTGLNGRLSYRLLHPDRNFQINSHTGSSKTANEWNKERYTECTKH